MPINDKKLKRLEALLDTFDSGAVQPDEMIKAIDAVMAVVKSTTESIAKKVTENDSTTKAKFVELSSEIEEALQQLATQTRKLDGDKATKVDLERLNANIKAEIERVTALIPEMPDEFDASELYETVESHRSLIENISSLIVGENLRNALEALPEGEKLAIEAVEGLREELDKLAKDWRKGGSGGGLGSQIVLDIIAQAVADGTIPSGSGVSDGDKGDITVSSSGAAWTINDASVQMNDLDATGTPSASTFLRGDGSWATPAGSGDVSKVGTPVDNQVGVWTGDGTIEGTSGLTYDGSALGVTGNITVSGTVDGVDIAARDHDAVTVTDSSEIDFTLTGQNITASIVAGSIDESKLDTSVNASLDLADSAVQPGDLATVATTGAYSDLSGTPTLATVATTGAYSDLSGTPDLTGYQVEPVVVSGSLTASNDTVYHNVASATYTDPSPVEGKGFVVFVRNGTATVGGTGYSTAGTIIHRIYHSGAWANYVYLNKAQLDTTYQPLDAELTAIAGLTSVADRGIYFTGSGTASLFTLTSAARSILDDASTTAIRTTLGVGTGDSPQFTAVNIGNATDTTVARVSAGQISVEGVQVATATNTLTLTNKTLTAPVISTISNTGTLTLPTSTDTLVGRATTDTLTNKTLTAPKLTVSNLSNLGATEAIDWNSADIFYGTLDANVNITHSNEASGRTITLHLAYDASAQRTITWTDVDRWTDNATGAAPTTPSASGEVLTVTMQYYGTTCVASATGNYAVYA